jgi:hypothetical protein
VRVGRDRAQRGLLVAVGGETLFGRRKHDVA